MEIHYEMLVTGCSICGHRSATNTVVLGAAGQYCENHVGFAVGMARRQRDSQLRAMLATGKISLPTKLWEPSTPPRDGVE